MANGTCGDFYGADPQCWKKKNDITIFNVFKDLDKEIYQELLG